MKLVEKQVAQKLRKQGMSINQIVATTGFSKASVSIWVRDIILTKSQKNKVTLRGRSVASIEKRRLSRLAHEHQKSRDIIENAKQSIKTLSLADLKIIGIILYLGEGGKTRKGIVRVTNSDPDVIRIIMRFFREVCRVPERKFYCHIHTFDTANIEQTERYWAQVTGIPRNQFYKTYMKQSVASLHKRKTIPYGTADVGVNDTVLFLTIMGWIEKIKELAS